MKKVAILMKSSEIDIYNETEFRSWVKNINVALTENNFCSMIEEHNREMDNRKDITKKEYLKDLPSGVRWRMEGKITPCLDGRKTIVMSIDTSEKIRIKAYKFMNAFINCISKIGGNVYVDKMEDYDNTMATLLESRYKCKLYEKQVKLRNRIKTDNRKMSPLYELEYNGDFCFEVFAEDKNKKWESLMAIEIHNSGVGESKLADLFWRLRDDAISKKTIIEQERAKQEEARKKQIKQWEEDEIREERIRMEREELIKKEKIQEKIKNHMDNWEYINNISMYINDLRTVSGVSDDERKLILNYCEYVEKLYSKSDFFKEILEFSQKLET
ncbi:hypothetical protein HGI53_04790 [Clostridium beijerinckii]|uniref:PH domain-containing protein n=3 Tax=Clostridium beijerinckii TaxID=1520 RepID=A0AAW3W504_CLOBE|nr:hypothetical protein [Clostridium beijerinckii]MBC2473950.1 hypothetical protein [Clostridium beijerinckii]